jgi:hypothetical protein
MFSKKDEPKGKKISLDQMCFTNSVCVEAIVNTLVKKGICTREEVLTEVKRLSEIAGRRTEEAN